MKSDIFLGNKIQVESNHKLSIGDLYYFSLQLT